MQLTSCRSFPIHSSLDPTLLSSSSLSLIRQLENYALLPVILPTPRLLWIQSLFPLPTSSSATTRTPGLVGRTTKSQIIIASIPQASPTHNSGCWILPLYQPTDALVLESLDYKLRIYKPFHLCGTPWFCNLTTTGAAAGAVNHFFCLWCMLYLYDHERSGIYSFSLSYTCEANCPSSVGLASSHFAHLSRTPLPHLYAHMMSKLETLIQLHYLRGWDKRQNFPTYSGCYSNTTSTHFRKLVKRFPWHWYGTCHGGCVCVEYSQLSIELLSEIIL